jgi:hypothetical protein
MALFDMSRPGIIRLRGFVKVMSDLLTTHITPDQAAADVPM